jgi:hypothetical protein
MRLITNSDTKSTKLVFFVFAALGGILLFVASRAQPTPDSSKAIWLGWGLVAGGLLALVFVEEVMVFGDESTSNLVVLKRNMFWNRVREIPYTEIQNFKAVPMGRSRGPRSYQLVIELKTSERINTGRWSYDASVITREAENLDKLMNAASAPASDRKGVQVPLSQSQYIMYAFLSAVVFYSIWYRVLVGPWCPAMWAGTSPFLVMGFCFVFCLRFLTNLRL